MLSNIYWKELSLLSFVWLGFLVIQLLKVCVCIPCCVLTHLLYTIINGRNDNTYAELYMYFVRKRWAKLLLTWELESKTTHDPSPLLSFITAYERMLLSLWFNRSVVCAEIYSDLFRTILASGFITGKTQKFQKLEWVNLYVLYYIVVPYKWKES